MTLRSSALAAAALLAAALPCPAADAGKRDDSASEKLGMKLSLQCWTYRELTFFETVDRAAALGVKYLEMYPGQKLKPGSDVKVNRDMSDETIAEIKKKLADAGGLKLIAYGVDGVPDRRAGRRKDFEWAKKMGIERPRHRDDAQRHPRQARQGVQHPHGPAQPPDDLAAGQGAEGLRGPLQADRLLLATPATGCGPTSSPSISSRSSKAASSTCTSRTSTSSARSHDVAWGTGSGDVKGMLEELKRQGYKGYLSIEYEYGDLKHLDDQPAQVRRVLRQHDERIGEVRSRCGDSLPPPPLWGRVGVGGGSFRSIDPPPRPSPARGEGVGNPFYAFADAARSNSTASRPVMPTRTPYSSARGVASTMWASNRSSGSISGFSGVPRAMATA